MTELMYSVLSTAGGLLLLFALAYGFYSFIVWMFKYPK